MNLFPKWRFYITKMWLCCIDLIAQNLSIFVPGLLKKDAGKVRWTPYWWILQYQHLYYFLSVLHYNQCFWFRKYILSKEVPVCLLPCLIMIFCVSTEEKKKSRALNRFTPSNSHCWIIRLSSFKQDFPLALEFLSGWSIENSQSYKKHSK